MSKKRYLVLVWLKAKNVAMEYVESLDVIRTIKKLYKHDKVEIVDMEPFEEKPKEAEGTNKQPLGTKKSKGRTKGWATKVRCVETGEIWRSVAECHRRTGYGFFQLNSACTTGRDLDGKHYEYYREYNKASVLPSVDADGDKSDDK